MRNLLFRALRLYVAIERPFRAFARWWRDEQPDVILEPLSIPNEAEREVHDATPVYVTADMQAAYGFDRNGKTLRRVAQTDDGEIVYLKKLPKKQRRAMKRAERRHGNHTAQIGT